MIQDATSHLRVVLSGMAGSASLACWIVLLLPQLIEQWRLKSADGISIGFLVIWLLGDITNLAGSLWAGLRPEVVLLAVWYCLADSLIMLSYFYYKRLAKLTEIRRQKRRASSGDQDENAPLLDRRNSASRKRSSAASAERRHSHRESRRDSLSTIVLDASSQSTVWTQVVFPVLFVIAAGLLGYFLSDGDVAPPEDDNDLQMSLGPQILGYVSAVLYLSARIPQIVQNHQRRSVYGLSLVFFIFSILGNLTYAGGILIYRSDSEWVKLYFPWLLGSLGTIFEDVIIFIQFYVYREQPHDPESAVTE